MTPTMRVPARSRVRYTELGTVILGGGPHQIYSQVHRAGGQLYWGVGGSLTVVFGWRSVAEEPLLTC